MLLILGLDGATLDLVEPWVADGTLPNLGRLIREGAWGVLESTIPAATFPSWTTFMTGVNPGRHGIFDFTRRDPGAYRVRFVNATYRRAPSVWRLLSHAGRRIAVFGVPGTYPPEAVNGCMVSGFDTPVTTRADASFAYPESFAADVAACGGFPFADFQEFSVGDGWHRRALASLLAGLDKKERLVCRVIEQGSWDCIMLLIGESDTAAHHFWSFHDPRSPRHRPVASVGLEGDPLRTVYAAIDALVGRLLDRVAPDHVLIASDHGFGGVGETALHLNRWLAKEGFLRWHPAAVTARVAGVARRAALRLVPEKAQASLFRLAGGRIANRIESTARFGGIDWAGTRAFSEELNYAPAIWLNVEGRDACGQVLAADVEATLAEVTRRLLAWVDPYTKQPVISTVYRRDDVYAGDCIAMAPDLILDLATPGGYSYTCLPSGGTGGDPVRRLSGPELVGGKLRGMSGSHRREGLFVVTGPDVQPGRVEGVGIADMAPTLLALCGVRAPVEWDGRLLSCVGGEDLSPGEVQAVPAGLESPYESGEEAGIRERLQQLGYLE